MIYSVVKIFLFLFPAERAHHITTFLLNAFCSVPFLGHFIKWVFKYEDSSLNISLWGLKFKNPIGLAAGFDKDGKYINAMSSLGFGFIEVGTVTPRPQRGNPKPRLFRLKKDHAIINRMGFNNQGVQVLVERLKKRKEKDVIIGGNIGKNKDTPNERAKEDYLFCFKKLYQYVDYFVVNLSSPNTPGLRSLQAKEPLRNILSPLVAYRKVQDITRPILVKIAPDLDIDQLKAIIEIVRELNIDGIVATNTTISRDNLKTSPQKISDIGPGGLSGIPLSQISTEMIASISGLTNGQLPIIGVGGVDSVFAVQQKINAGASLVQIYSGLVYRGPFLVKKIKKQLLVKSLPA